MTSSKSANGANKGVTNDSRKAFVSVILPAFNASAWIEETLQSLVSQSHENFELLVLDDGSTDNTLEIIRRFERQDNRIRVFVQKNMGVIAARNKLLDEARGQYVMFQDADDISTPDRMEKQVELLQANPEAVGVSSWIEYFDSKPGAEIKTRKILRKPERVDVHWPSSIKDALLGFSLPGSTINYNHALVKQLRFRPFFKGSEDVDFNLRLLSLGELMNTQTVQYRCRRHGKNTASRMLYNKIESSVLARVFAYRRYHGRTDLVFGQQTPFLRLFCNGLTVHEFVTSLFLIGRRLVKRLPKYIVNRMCHPR